MKHSYLCYTTTHSILKKNLPSAKVCIQNKTYGKNQTEANHLNLYNFVKTSLRQNSNVLRKYSDSWAGGSD